VCRWARLDTKVRAGKEATKAGMSPPSRRLMRSAIHPRRTTSVTRRRAGRGGWAQTRRLEERVVQRGEVRADGQFRGQLILVVTRHLLKVRKVAVLVRPGDGTHGLDLSGCVYLSASLMLTRVCMSSGCEKELNKYRRREREGGAPG
jgi:hypothetical protein